MKVLFVCVGNISRSQIAETFFGSSSRHESESAGTGVGKNDGQALIEAAVRVIDVMRAEGLDVSRNIRRQLTPAMLDGADKVIAMVQEERRPDYLTENHKVVFWDIEDPLGRPYEFLVEVKGQVKQRVDELVRAIG